MGESHIRTVQPSKHDLSALGNHTDIAGTVPFLHQKGKRKDTVNEIGKPRTVRPHDRDSQAVGFPDQLSLKLFPLRSRLTVSAGKDHGSSAVLPCRFP